MRYGPFLTFAVAAAVFAGTAALPARGQAAAPDAGTQAAILAELRSIHRDIRLNTNTQVLLAELEADQTALDHALDRRDTLRKDLAQTDAAIRVANAGIAAMEDANSGSLSATPRGTLSDRLGAAQSEHSRLEAERQSESERLRESETRAATARTELNAVQAELKSLLRKLGPVE